MLVLLRRQSPLLIRSDLMTNTASSAPLDAYKQAVATAFDAALAAGHPAQITADAMASLGHMPTAVIAIGKAAASMAGAVRAAGCMAPGIMVTTDENFAEIDNMRCFASAHPVPDERGIIAAQAVGAFADNLTADDELLLLISGGGSALVPAPPSPLTLADKQSLNEALLASGLDIHAMNVVRRLFSDLKGGRLARRAHPASMTAFLLSDVPGDRLESIASGPAAPDPVPFEDAIRLMADHGLDQLPFARAHLAALAKDPSRQPVRPGDPVMDGVASHILASNQLCQDAAMTALMAALIGGVDACDQDDAGLASFALPPLVDDVRVCARHLATSVCAAAPASVATPATLANKAVTKYAVTGGETTVQLGDGPVGLGGRSQELALAFAAEMHDRSDAPHRWVILAGGTDGRDGPTDAAGALITSDDTALDIWDRDAVAATLAAHDAHPFLDFHNLLLRVNPTGTNLADLAIVIAEWSPDGKS